MSGIDSQAGAEVADDSGEPGAPRRREPWLRFALIFGSLAIASEFTFYAFTLESDLFDVYLGVLARISGAFIAYFDPEVVVSGTRISNPRFAILVAEGCDAIQVCSLLAAAIIAFPIGLRHKIRGLVIGIAVLQLLNLARIISLFWIGIHFHTVFHKAHEVVWPTFLIAVTIAIWLQWVRWETRSADGAGHAA